MTDYQKRVQATLSRSGNCPICYGIGKVVPAGPVKIGAKLPICTACSGTGKN